MGGGEVYDYFREHRLPIVVFMWQCRRQFILEYVYILTFYVYLQLFSNMNKDLI